ncbi:hypothetical protein DFH09DRAFT_218720 [Mycena vulgaris]|nr:hypothetical protein DFH09DRAFT_218720 [Mycena vulgaris]
MEFNDLDISLAILPPEAPPDVQLTEQLARLSLRLDNTRDVLANHMSSIAYGRQVPVEVLEVIFQMCLPETDYISPDPLQAPLLLCQVCNSWRRVAISTPALWCSLAIHLRRRRGAWKAFLESWLGRCRKSPISLSIAGDTNMSCQYFNDHIAKLFLRHAKRWRRLRFEDVPATVRTKLLNTHMPRLETLEITGGGVHLFSADAPRLRTLTLLDAQTDPSSIHVPWARLTTFRSGNYIFDLDRCFTHLAKCKNLTRCTIQLAMASWTQTSQPLLPLRMAALQSLVLIGAIGGDAVTAFFANVELPSLDSLTLITVRGASSGFGLPQSLLVALARRSNLRSLCLTGGQPLVSELFDAVVAIPSLREVVLRAANGTMAVKGLPNAVQEALDMRRSESK